MKGTRLLAAVVLLATGFGLPGLASASPQSTSLIRLATRGITATPAKCKEPKCKPKAPHCNKPGCTPGCCR